MTPMLKRICAEIEKTAETSSRAIARSNTQRAAVGMQQRRQAAAPARQERSAARQEGSAARQQRSTERRQAFVGGVARASGRPAPAPAPTPAQAPAQRPAPRQMARAVPVEQQPRRIAREIPVEQGTMQAWGRQRNAQRPAPQQRQPAPQRQAMPQQRQTAPQRQPAPQQRQAAQGPVRQQQAYAPRPDTFGGARQFGYGQQQRQLSRPGIYDKIMNFARNMRGTIRGRQLRAETAFGTRVRPISQRPAGAEM